MFPQKKAFLDVIQTNCVCDDNTQGRNGIVCIPDVHVPPHDVPLVHRPETNVRRKLRVTLRSNFLPTLKSFM